MSRKERVGAKPHACVTVLAGTHKYTLKNFKIKMLFCFLSQFSEGEQNCLTA